MVTIRSRDDWGARAPHWTDQVSLSHWQGVRVHHSAGPAGQRLRTIQDYHMDTRGWPDIGYSFLISGGEVWEGRGWRTHPAHDSINDTLGVCVIGTYTDDLPTAEDLSALVAFIRHARETCGWDLPVDGHRDAPGAATACPGDRLYEHLPAIRRRADEEDTMDLDMSQRVELNPWAQDKFDLNDIALSTALGSGYAHARAAKYAIQDAREELAAGQAAILAKLDGGDDDTVRVAVREELDRHRAALVNALADDLAERVAEQLSDVPAEQVTAAVRAALERVRLRVGDDDE